MPTREESARSLFQRGEYVALLRDFSHAIESPATTEPFVRLTVAHALAITGDLTNAKKLAKDLPADKDLLPVRAKASLVRGLAAERAGHVDEALKEYALGIGLLSDGSDDSLLAWLHLHQFRLISEGHSMKALTAMIPLVRRLILRLGDPQLTAYMHMCIAVLEGETGHFDEALRHSSVADSLLEIGESLALRSANLVNRGCLAIVAGNLNEAADCFQLAKKLTLQTGDRFISSRADGNLAHIHLFAGELEAAQTLFERTIREGTFGKLGEVGALDGLARVHLVNQDLEACATCLDTIASYSDRHEALPSMYHVRWAGLTKARLLLRQGKFEEGSRLLARLHTETVAVNDRPFDIALSLHSAMTSCRRGDPAGASQSAFKADRLGACTMAELQPQYYFVSALTVVNAKPALAEFLVNRANRLWAFQGVVTTRAELDPAGIDLGTIRAQLTASQTIERIAASTIETVTNSIAAALDLSWNPRLFGMELLAVINGLGCSDGAVLQEVNGELPIVNERTVVVPLGNEGEKTLALSCPIPKDPVKAILLGDVIRLSDAGRALERARKEEKTRSAVWPESPLEEQAGAFFIAEEMQALLSTVRRVAPSPIPVLITGETGTGKEVLARTIHGYSDRATKPFIPFNCSATPREMLDAQLFGYRKGAFTGANEHFPGVIRAAAGGTIFLDEIGELTLDLQPKLLRFLEGGEVHPLGETQPVKVNVRVIAATNADLDTMVAHGRFREDLYYRLNIIRLPVPPLRARREEIPVLAAHYLDRSAAELGKQGLRLAEETVEYLVLYQWPGNIRQLANEMRRIATLADNGAIVMPEHLSAPIAASRRTKPASERALDPTEVVVRLDQPVAAATAHLERTMILHVLRKTGGHMENAAAMLGLSRKGLYLKRQRLGLDAVASL